jgi:hypothetical protein
VAHAVGFQPQHAVQRLLGHVLEVVGAVAVGGAVEVGGAQLLGGLEVVVVEVLRAVEHQVLEEVGEAGAAGGLVLGAHVVPDVHRHDRGLVVLVDDHRQPVLQHELLVGDVELDLGERRGGRRHGRLLGRLGGRRRKHEKGGAGRQHD